MIDKYKNAVKLEDGSVEAFVLTVEGKDFFCECGCNVFHKPNIDDLSIYGCNGCNRKYKRK